MPECAPPTQKLALIIPALREAENLCGLLSRVRRALADLQIAYEILVVDDDSNDGTEEMVASIADADARVRLLVRREAKGLSGAILHGWEHTNGTILGVMDADGQHPPELLPALAEAILRGRDLAIGSRFAEGGCGGWNPMRRIISVVAIWAAYPLQRCSLRVKDPLSGFFLVRRQCVENVSFQPAGFKLLLEILVRGRIETVEEVPFAFGRRRTGRSKVSVKVGWDYVVLLARLYSWWLGRVRIRSRRGRSKPLTS
jgi:dolichol-phosphate mannosyltransferase